MRADNRDRGLGSALERRSIATPGKRCDTHREEPEERGADFQGQLPFFFRLAYSALHDDSLFDVAATNASHCIFNDASVCPAQHARKSLQVLVFAAAVLVVLGTGEVEVALPLPLSPL